MLLKFFRGTGPGIVILIFLAGCGLWLNAVLHPLLPDMFHYDQQPMPLYAFLRNIALKNALGGTIFSFVMVILMTYLLVNFNTTLFFINERTFLPSVIFLLVSSFFPAFQLFNPVLPSAVLLMLAIKRIMEAYRKNGTAYNFFDASLLIGTSSLLYANMIWFGLLSIIGIAILRTGNLKEILLALLGLCTPLAIATGVYYVAGNDPAELIRLSYYNLFGRAETFEFTRVTIAGLIILGLVLLFSIFFLLAELSSKKIRSRKTFSLLIYTFIISITVYFAVPSVSLEMIYIAAIPVSYFLTHYFIFSKRKIVPEIFFLAILIIVVVIQVMYSL
ncbi:MAG: hypothetical protein U0T33_06460 [Bacteroidales bacterium]